MRDMFELPHINPDDMLTAEVRHRSIGWGLRHNAHTLPNGAIVLDFESPSVILSDRHFPEAIEVLTTAAVRHLQLTPYMPGPRRIGYVLNHENGLLVGTAVDEVDQPVPAVPQFDLRLHRKEKRADAAFDSSTYISPLINLHEMDEKRACTVSFSDPRDDD